MEGCLIVDGYNVLHGWTSMAKLLAEDVEHARDRLVHQLSNFGATQGIKVVVVFDAHLVKGGQGSTEEWGGVKVIYTPEGVTADMAIEKLAVRLAGRNKITVASSDWAEQRLVFGQGAVRMSARELETEVLAAETESKAYKEYTEPVESGIRGQLTKEIKEVLEKIRRSK